MRDGNIISLKAARSRLRRPHPVQPPAALINAIPTHTRAGGEEDAEDRVRMRQNVAALILVASILVLGTWLIDSLQTYSRIQMCVEAGHRNCLPVDQKHQPSPF